jgi:aspartate-semialdehyde dehydrogenase
MSERPGESRGLRILLVGATGALGQEVRAALEASSLPIAALVPLASERSRGTEIEFRGELLYVESELPSLRGIDLLVLCAPAEASLDLIREALRAEVACIDCSGALADSPEIPVVMRGHSSAAELTAPVVSVPSGVALGWARVVLALEKAAGIERVVGTVLHPAAHAGRRGIEALSAESIALLSQREAPESDVFAGPVAFDCLAEANAGAHAPGAAAESGTSALEAGLRAHLARLLDREAVLAVTGVQVPTFVGEGSSLAVETRRPLSVEDAMSAIDKAEGVELWAGEDAPSTRDTAGRDDALVGRVRRDPSRENGLLLWIATDGLRLVASEVVGVAEMRLRLN